MGKTKQKQKSHFLFTFLIRLVLFLYLIAILAVIYSSKISLHGFIGCLNNYTPRGNKSFNPRNQNHHVLSVKLRKSTFAYSASHDTHSTRADLRTIIEGLHDAVHTQYAGLCPAAWFPFYMALYGEKQQKTLELLIYFIERIKISTECVC